MPLNVLGSIGSAFIPSPPPPPSPATFKLVGRSGTVPTSDDLGNTVTTLGSMSMVNDATRSFVFSTNDGTGNFQISRTTGASFTRCIWGKRTSALPENRNLFSSASVPIWYNQTNFINCSASTANVRDNVDRTTSWAHYVVTYDGASLKLYVNGGLIQSAALTTFTGDTSTHSIGAYPTTSNRWRGYFDDIRMYTRALTDAEILEIYNTPKANL
jgi:hypothetical protein